MFNIIKWIGGRNEKSDIEQADYETAISATKFGCFNYTLTLLMTFPVGLSTTFVTTSISYVIPAAECDLKLTMIDKGLLNSSVYIGIIATALPWGYIADTLGRRKLLIISFFLNSICDIAIIFTHRKWYLIMLKVLDGGIVSGPISSIMPYLSELHSKSNRDRALLSFGKAQCLGQLILPLIAYFIMPQSFKVIIIEHVIELKSWHIFLLICSFPSILTVIFVTFFPESPKFLMTQGRNDEALDILRNIFSMNTRKPKNEYPIHSLINELRNKKSSSNEEKENVSKKSFIRREIKRAWIHLVPIFRQPYLAPACTIFTYQFLLYLTWNAFRLWLPQIFTIINRYEEGITHKIEEPTLCSLIDADVHISNEISNKIVDDECDEDIPEDTYLQSVYIGIVSMMAFMVATFIVKYTGQLLILKVNTFICGICIILMYWVKTSLAAVILSSIYVSLLMLNTNVIGNLCVTTFPTSLRATAVAIGLMSGRAGSVLGNILLPILLNCGCLYQFIFGFVLCMIATIISFSIPDTKNKALI